MFDLRNLVTSVRTSLAFATSVSADGRGDGPLVCHQAALPHWVWQLPTAERHMTIQYMPTVCDTLHLVLGPMLEKSPHFKWEVTYNCHAHVQVHITCRCAVAVHCINLMDCVVTAQQASFSISRQCTCLVLPLKQTTLPTCQPLQSVVFHGLHQWRAIH